MGIIITYKPRQDNKIYKTYNIAKAMINSGGPYARINAAQVVSKLPKQVSWQVAKMLDEEINNNAHI